MSFYLDLYGKCMGLRSFCIGPLPIHLFWITSWNQILTWASQQTINLPCGDGIHYPFMVILGDGLSLALPYYNYYMNCSVKLHQLLHQKIIAIGSWAQHPKKSCITPKHISKIAINSTFSGSFFWGYHTCILSLKLAMAVECMCTYRYSANLSLLTMKKMYIITMSISWWVGNPLPVGVYFSSWRW